MSALEEPTPYERLGGATGVRRIVERFYDLMDQDPGLVRLRRLHATDLTPMREKLFEFLSGWLGGPPLYFERPEAPCIASAHRPYAIDSGLRDEWLDCMRRALEDCGTGADLRQLLDKPLLRIAEAFRNC
jgi:hemoglobin